MNRLLFACLLVSSSLALSRLGAGEPVDFSKDVKPILAKNCTVCHGEDEQQSGLRLDAGALVLQGGDHGPSVVAGKSGESLLIRVLAEGGDLPQMPLDEEPLKAEEIALIKRWIDEGAKIPANEKIKVTAARGSRHWAFQPVKRPSPPQVRQAHWAKNSIDQFILAKLERLNLRPSPAADKATLIRRVSLDLTGVPPTLDEVQQFLADESPDAYERVVDRLLASARYGERWGRHWLDVARYADSHGFTIDGPRSIWPYRDWVIDAINRDLPFDQFTIDQIAGDMLPNATLAQIVATGFHRNTLINQEGGTDQEQFRVEAVVDRISTTGSAYLGLTIGCARCHGHKYDPISQREFYQLFALFNNADEPTTPVPSARQVEQQEEIKGRLRTAEARLRAYEAEQDKQRQEAERRLAATSLDVKWYPLNPSEYKSAGGATISELDDYSLVVGGKVPQSDTYTVTFEVPVRGATALRLEALTHESLPNTGPGLAGNGNFVLTDFAVARRTLAEPDVHHPVKLVGATADHAQPRFPVEGAIDDDPERSGWAINLTGGKLNANRSAVFILEQPLREDDTRVTLTITHGHTSRYSLGRFRVSVTPAPAEILTLGDDLRAALATPEEKRTAAQREALRVELHRHDAGRLPLQADVNRIRKELDALNKTVPTTMVLRERAKPRETFIHIRGDFLRHGARVQGKVPAVLPPFPQGVQAGDRLDFARWLVDPANPLTPRVTVNRSWQQFFGRGIVETESDFGTQGDKPTHPELLDWLASELIRQGWSMKALHRLIVTSATYRQSSLARPQQLQADRYNKWLGRQSRLRMEAETIRDAALAAAGVLTNKIGGPSVFPPQPGGIYDFTQNQKNWKPSEGGDRFRRGLYTHLWRSSADPFLMTFDAPSGNVTCTRRVRSNTPLQSLTLANDVAFVEIAQHLAARVLRECPSQAVEDRVRHTFSLCLSREPGDRELSRLQAYYHEQVARFSQAGSDAQKFAAPQLPPRTTPEMGAAWTAVARVLLNLDEFITRE